MTTHNFIKLSKCFIDVNELKKQIKKNVFDKGDIN